MKPKQFFTQYMPDYCWCTSFELFLMYEQENEDIDYDVFKTQLSYYSNPKRGFGVIKREYDNSTGKPLGHPGGGWIRYQYLRKTPEKRPNFSGDDNED